ncbi:hypothetical protein [Cryobacterium sp. SO1]|uniref:hypothetical protein n=1 Tax=Cryobacterium sp. SO1 TaxID=1897061 RepID=UPI00102344F8|nr:hypothetical protein [Cryobacterium sp. SO1]RZI36677.1 hypothetical protein BJQ95_00893 [Cryobacterium sp. SO1]
MLYLIQKTMVGEPVGIHSEGGQSYFWPGRDQQAGLGRAIAGTKGTKVPWDVFVDHKSGAVNHQMFWGAADSDTDLQSTLNQARDKYFANHS